jgi:predicted RNase H-like nuclease (RuvC/YqgF family)
MSDRLNSELESLKALMTRQEREVTRLQGEINNLETDLEKFHSEYEQVVGTMQRQVDAAKEELDNLEREIMARGQNFSPLRDFQTYLPEHFIPVEEQYHEVWIEGRKRGAKIRAQPKREAYEGSEKQQIKKLFRDLAQRYHPDLAIDENDRERRTEAMALINEANSEHDLDAMKAIHELGEKVDVSLSLTALKLRRYKQMSNELDGRINALRAEHEALLHSDIMQMKTDANLARQRGRNLLREMAADLEQEYRQARTKMDELRGDNRWLKG